MKQKIIVSGSIFIIIGIILIFTLFKRGKNSVINYKKEVLDKGNVEALVSTTGVVNPVTIIEVGSQVSGRILKILVDFNSRVKKGQVLAEIDPSQFLTRIKQNEANYESSKAALERSMVISEIAEKKYKRAEELFEKEMISFEEKEDVEAQYYTSKADVQAAEARLQQSKSQLESSQVDLGYTIIKSPIDGIVISRNINVGQTVAASFQAPVLFQIANDLSKMQLECSVDEADIGKISEGQRVRFTVDAFPDENFRGVITQVRYASEVIQNVVTYTTVVDVDNPETKLRPGMTATVLIVAKEAKDVLLVPNSAMRFATSISRAEMSGEMNQSRNGARYESRRGVSQSSEMRGGQISSIDGGDSLQGNLRSQSSCVRIEDENGQIKPVFFRAGVTDDSYTEVVRGDLKQGQIVITGIGSGRNNKGSSSRNPMTSRTSRRMFGRR